MGKSVNNDILDAGFLLVKNNSNLIVLCSQEPTTRSEAVTTYKLASKVIDSTDFTGPLDNVSGGRKLTINAQSSINIENSGIATHVAIVDDTRLLYVTTCNSRQVYVGDIVNLPSWSAIIEDPT